MIAVLLVELGMCNPLAVTTGQGVAVGFMDAGVEGMRVWLGIPYAAPPVGQLRWAAPQPPAGWGPEPRTFDTLTPACMQSFVGGINPGAPTAEPSEDCLFLNVYSPLNASAPSSLLPVMVWFHGGAFSIGYATATPAPVLSMRGSVVVVTVDYRLGPWGFAVFSDGANADANFGLDDQVQALQWVNSQIAAFGGDPNRVTIFGESAGGGSVLFHALYPPSWPYFRAGLMESPGVFSLPTLSRNAATTSSWAAMFNCTDSASLLPCMRALPASLLQPPNGAAPWAPTMGFLPCVDGRWFSDQPLSLFLAGRWKPMPLMVGWNAEEQNLLGFADIGTPPQVPLTDAGWTRHLQAIFGPGANQPGTLAEYVQSAYAPLRKALGNWQALALALSDWSIIFRCPQILNQALLASPSPVYLYFWTQTPSQWPFFGSLGATHTVEIPFVFGNASIEGMVFDAADTAFSYQALAMWASFATTLAPSPSWPDYRQNQLVQTMQIGFPPPSLYPNISDPSSCAGWLPYLQKGVFPSPSH